MSTPHCPVCGRWDGSHSGGCPNTGQPYPGTEPREVDALLADVAAVASEREDGRAYETRQGKALAALLQDPALLAIAEALPALRDYLSLMTDYEVVLMYGETTGGFLNSLRRGRIDVTD